MRINKHIILSALALLPIAGCIDDQAADEIDLMAGDEAVDETVEAIDGATPYFGCLFGPNPPSPPDVFIDLSSSQSQSENGTPAGSGNCKKFTVELDEASEFTARIFYPVVPPIFNATTCAAQKLKVAYYVPDEVNGGFDLASQTKSGAWNAFQNTCTLPQVSYESETVTVGQPPLQIRRRVVHRPLVVIVQAESGTSSALPVRVTGTYDGTPN